MSDSKRTMPKVLPSGGQVIPGAGRYVCRGIGRPKRKSKLLKRALDEAGYKIGLLKCLELVARMYGYANYHELFYTVDGVTCSRSKSVV